MTDQPLLIGADAPEDHLARAADELAAGGLVLLDGGVALRRRHGRLECDVVDPQPGSRRCALEHDVLLENAQRALAASRLWRHLPDLPLRWRIVDAQGTVLDTASRPGHE